MWQRRRWLLRQRSAGLGALDRILGQTFFIAGGLSLLSLAIDAYAGAENLPRVLTGKLAICLAFLCSGVLANRTWRRSALTLSLLVAVGALSFGAAGYGPTARGFFQLSSLLLVPFLAVVGTVGDLRAAAGAGLSVVLSAQLVAHAWGSSREERLLSLLVSLLAGALACAMALVLGEWKRQTLRDQRAGRRAARRLAIAQREREASERMAVLGRLASTMAHEINNPLAYAMANLRYVAETLEGQPSPAADELQLALKDGEEGLARIHAIVGRMSDFRPPAPSAAVATDVRHALEAFVSGLELTAPARARLVLEAGPALPAAALDPLRLGRVLRAVVTNALEAVEHQEQKRVTIAAHRFGERLQVIVDDQGPGIDPAVLSRLFEPFVTAPGSTKLGLSLALARELVRSVGGELRASNRPEGGARVVVELPVATSS